MSKQQTAVNWLWQQLNEKDIKTIHELSNFFERAKQIECEQIARAWERRAMDVNGYDYYRLYHGQIPFGVTND